jgi:hypothetical protein
MAGRLRLCADLASHCCFADHVEVVTGSYAPYSKSQVSHHAKQLPRVRASACSAFIPPLLASLFGALSRAWLSLVCPIRRPGADAD